MSNLFFRILLHGCVSFFSGFSAGSLGVLLYLYYKYDTGITFTGLIVADWMLFIGMAGFAVKYTRESYILWRAVRAAKRRLKNDEQTNTKEF